MCNVCVMVDTTVCELDFNCDFMVFYTPTYMYLFFNMSNKVISWF